MMSLKGVQDQGIREWIRYHYTRAIESGLTPEQAEKNVSDRATKTFGKWRIDIHRQPR